MESGDCVCEKGVFVVRGELGGQLLERCDGHWECGGKYLPVWGLLKAVVVGLCLWGRSVRLLACVGGCQVSVECPLRSYVYRS